MLLRDDLAVGFFRRQLFGERYYFDSSRSKNNIEPTTQVEKDTAALDIRVSKRLTPAQGDNRVRYDVKNWKIFSGAATAACQNLTRDLGFVSTAYAERYFLNSKN